MRLLGAAFALLAVTACSTHDTNLCWDVCDDGDYEDFVACVANGHADCEAGNRRCCALQQECIGTLEDQTVQSSRTGCMFADEMFCEPECTDADEDAYDLCLTMGGSGACPPGDEICCALAQPCLGELGDVLVTRDGCCSDDADCDDDEYCETMTGECYPYDLCGDGEETGDEECDDGPEPITECEYGMMSCVICTSDCLEEEGAASYCGDTFVDMPNGESCDPPGTARCDALCQRIVPATCSDGRMGPGETDLDCGGLECLPCAPGRACLVDGDCGLLDPTCSGTPFCAGMCSVMDECDDFDDCTSDFCDPDGAGCAHHNSFDSDGDDDGLRGSGCGDDCDDTRADVSSLEVDDFGCATGGTPDDRVDNDCDGAIDESGCSP